MVFDTKGYANYLTKDDDTTKGIVNIPVSIKSVITVKVNMPIIRACFLRVNPFTLAFEKLLSLQSLFFVFVLE